MFCHVRIYLKSLSDLRDHLSFRSESETEIYRAPEESFNHLLKSRN